MATWRQRCALALTAIALAATPLECAGNHADVAQADSPPRQLAVRVAGVAVPTTGGVGDVVQSLRDRYLDAAVVVVSPRGEVTMTRRALGADVDTATLQGLVADARDPSAAIHRGRSGDFAMPVRLRSEIAMPWVIALKDSVDERAVDARVDLRAFQVLPERQGRELDVFLTLDRVMDALRDGSPRIVVAVNALPAARHAESLRGLDLREVLGSFETRFDPTEKARDRTFNLRIAASKIDGHVVMPGEIFDFNAVVGERSERNGFRVAPVIAQGELVDGIGGGTCQIAGTLHAAVFFAGLEILERRPHTRPSGYIRMGLDAAVAYPNLNFRFRNDTAAPLAIGYTLSGSRARVEIRGPRRTRMVTLTRRVDEILPFGERIESDPGLPAGVRVLKQRGTPGFVTQNFRIIRDLETNQARRVRREDRYPPTAQVWRVGSGPSVEGFVPPPGDSHDEYVADEYISITQGPRPEDNLESKRAGRTGTPGWTAAYLRR